jgi:hypothetical protein
MSDAAERRLPGRRALCGTPGSPSRAEASAELTDDVHQPRADTDTTPATSHPRLRQRRTHDQTRELLTELPTSTSKSARHTCRFRKRNLPRSPGTRGRRKRNSSMDIHGQRREEPIVSRSVITRTPNRSRDRAQRRRYGSICSVSDIADRSGSSASSPVRRRSVSSAAMIAEEAPRAGRQTSLLTARS